MKIQVCRISFRAKLWHAALERNTASQITKKHEISRHWRAREKNHASYIVHLSIIHIGFL